MADIIATLATLRRPRLLMRAARFGTMNYNRTRDLKRILGAHQTLSPSAALTRLMDEEARLEEIRIARDAAYSATRHVDLLIALLCEARLLRPVGQTA